MKGIRIAVVNPYLEGREGECEKNLYPRSHLWGADALMQAGAQVEFVRPDPQKWITRWLSALSRRANGRLGDLDVDWEVARRIRSFDLVYITTGRLLLTQMLCALRLVPTQLIAWVYLPPQYSPLWKLRDFWERFPFSMGIDGLFCLTKLAEKGWRKKWPGKKILHVDWGADAIMFPGSSGAGDFFFACGRTNRDYRTLLAAAAQVPYPITILASKNLVKGLPVPPNVTFVEGPQDSGTDKGIGYSELIGNYYAKAKAVLICRLDIPDDTSGLTNLLEAIAMGCPVAITRTGALDIEVEKEGVGRFLPPGDVAAWVSLLKEWSDRPEVLESMSGRARKLVETHYNHQRLGRDVATFVQMMVTEKIKGKY